MRNSPNLGWVSHNKKGDTMVIDERYISAFIRKKGLLHYLEIPIGNNDKISCPSSISIVIDRGRNEADYSISRSRDGKKIALTRGYAITSL